MTTLRPCVFSLSESQNMDIVNDLVQYDESWRELFFNALDRYSYRISMKIFKKGRTLSPEGGAYRAHKELRLKDEGHIQLCEVWQCLQ